MKFLQAGTQVIYNGKAGVVLGKPGTRSERRARIFCPPTPAPIGTAVGQYEDKVFSVSRVGSSWVEVLSINDRDAVDYGAWMDAFHKAYSES